MTPIDFKMPPGCYASPARAVHHRVSDALKGCDRVAKMVARDGVSRQPGQPFETASITKV